MSEAVISRLIPIIVRTVNVNRRDRAAQADADTELDYLGIDALDRVTICCAADEEWRIEISDHELESWLTVGDIVRTVEKRAQVRA